MWKWINFLALLFLATNAVAQVTVAAQLDSTEIMIGDQVRLNLIVNHAPDIKVTGADLSVLEKMDKVEVLKVGPWDTIGKSIEYVIEQNIILTSFDSGYYWLPKIPINYMSSNGQSGQAITRELPLSVNTIEIRSDSVQLAPIKPIIEEPLKFRDALPYLAGVVALALVVTLLFYLRKRRQQQEIQAQPEIKIPAHEIALQQLEELKKAKLWQQGHIKTYQSELTHIVREYLENRYNINALESTTYEIMQQLKRNDIPEEWRPRLRQMLETADLVKFAKAEPPIDIHARVMEEAEAFVLQTQKRVELVETEEISENGEEKITGIKNENH